MLPWGALPACAFLQVLHGVCEVMFACPSSTGRALLCQFRWADYALDTDFRFTSLHEDSTRSLSAPQDGQVLASAWQQ
jgi:hypothetical protein